MAYHWLISFSQEFSFIEPKDFDAEIEKALNMRVNYNFAIDLDGNRYIERPDGNVSIETTSEETKRVYSTEESENAATEAQN